MSTATQERLREELGERLQGAAGAGADPEGALAAYAVVARVDVAAYVAGAVEFAAGLEPPLAEAWLGAFTRTVFLAGDPVRIAARHRARQLAPDGSVGWFGPAEPDSLRGLRLLLKGLEAPALPPLPERVAVGDPGAGERPVLYLDTTGTGLADYLIHLNHLACEAAIAGLLVPGAALEVRHVEGIGDATGPFAATRVMPEPGGEARLRRYAALTAPGAPA